MGPVWKDFNVASVQRETRKGLAISMLYFSGKNILL
jgi:hypothetical protein